MKKICTLALLCLLTHWGVAQINVVAPDGDVGVGTDTPTEKLDVSGNTIVRGGSFLVGQEAGASDARVEIGAGRSSGGNAYFDLIGDIGNADLQDFGARLIRFSTGQTQFVHRGNLALNFRTINSAPLLLSTLNAERVRIVPGGNVGIGINSPSALLHVNGTAVKPGGGEWAAPSDARLKSNVQPFSDGLTTIMQINPVRYRYNGKAGIKSDQEHIGLVAQEVQQVAPYMVDKYVYTDIQVSGEGETYTETVGATEEYLSVDPSAIQYMLINAVKEQQKQIDERDRRIISLEQRLATLEAMVKRLSND